MTSGGENESDHSPLISDGGYKTVMEGDDNEPLPWECNSDEEGGAEGSVPKLEGIMELSSSRAIDRRLISPPDTLSKALCSFALPQAANYRRASSIRVNGSHSIMMTGNPKPQHHHMTATMADIRFNTNIKSPLSTENDSLTTNATITPSDVRSYEHHKFVDLKPAHHQRKPSISTLTGTQEYSSPPPWNELQKLDDLSAPLKLLKEKECNWSSICAALQDVRRLVLHHPDAVNMIVKKDSSMLLSLIPRILELVDNPRSLVAKNAVTTLHDIFLFTPAQVPASLIFDCLHCIMRRATGASFIAESALRCLEQIIIGAETFRTLHALMTVLTKEGRNFVTLRHMALYGSGLFLLRSTAVSLQAVVQHKDFVGSFLRPIVRATNDANQECRSAAAECCVILTNLWPDIRFKFKNHTSDFDLSAALLRAKRLYKPLKGFYNMEAVAEAYAQCPDHATIELAFDRLQIILANIEEISSQPLELDCPYVGAALVSRSVTPSSKGRLSPCGRPLGGISSTRRSVNRSPPAICTSYADRELDLASRGMLMSGASKVSPSIDRLTTPPERHSQLTICERSEVPSLTGLGPNRRMMMATMGAGLLAKREGGHQTASQSRFSFETDGRRLPPTYTTLMPQQMKRSGVAPIDEFDEAHLPAYATRGNLRYAPSGQRCTVDEQRRRRGL